MMKMFIMLIIMFILFFQGIFVFNSNYNHLLIMLLSLEFLVLTLFLILMYYFMNINSEFYFGMIFLTFSVCESALGLAILISLIRSHGNDYFKILSII
uniref:NADH-ubiquinone oxidoreductase chain 4L n=1 Tax=Pamphilius sp. ZJUH_2016023 TaxID=2491164 RepID=A0A3S8V0X7_9HYME|nr:NADH dehydrogenase subunit 4L [Pamphilius sp. ZJUH_2016023]